MNQQFFLLTIICSICICSIYAGDTVKYASSCSVDLCTLKNATNSTGNRTNSTGCPNIPLCYNFETSINTSFCAPQVVCSLFDPCTSAKRCATNTSVCVINTCCPAPICMPLSLASGCSMYTTPTARSSWSGTICPNATWAYNGTVAINNYLNSSYYAYFNDFNFDTNNYIYVVESNYYRILKFALNNPSTYSVVAVTSVSSTYQAQSIYVDSNNSIYSAESWYNSNGAVYYYRIVKYTQQNGVGNGVIIYGPTTCGTTLGELCGCGGLFVDSSGSIYYSDTSNHRVLKITPFASSATLVAGTSGMSGSLSNQLSSPSGIAVDSNGALYVADSSNYRLIKFPAGNNLGTVLYNFPSYTSPTSVTLDNTGSVYFGAGGGIYRYISSSNAVVQIGQQYYSSYGIRVRMDSYGNLYSNDNMYYTIYKYNLTANYC